MRAFGLVERRLGAFGDRWVLGLLIGVEMSGPARPYCEALMERGILAKETHDHTIRIAPPLVITDSQIDWALEQFDRALAA